jgi:hypothetical protein
VSLVSRGSHRLVCSTKSSKSPKTMQATITTIDSVSCQFGCAEEMQVKSSTISKQEKNGGGKIERSCVYFFDSNHSHFLKFVCLPPSPLLTLAVQRVGLHPALLGCLGLSPHIQSQRFFFCCCHAQERPQAVHTCVHQKQIRAAGSSGTYAGPSHGIESVPCMRYRSLDVEVSTQYA